MSSESLKGTSMPGSHFSSPLCPSWSTPEPLPHSTSEDISSPWSTWLGWHPLGVCGTGLTGLARRVLTVTPFLDCGSAHPWRFSHSLLSTGQVGLTSPLPSSLTAFDIFSVPSSARTQERPGVGWSQQGQQNSPGWTTQSSTLAPTASVGPDCPAPSLSCPGEGHIQLPYLQGNQVKLKDNTKIST